MAVAQDKFNLLRGKAYEGQVSDLNVARIDSCPNAEEKAIPFGRFLVASGDGQGVTLPNDQSKPRHFVGVSVRNPTWSNNQDGQPYYNQYDIVSVLKSDRVFVVANGGCARGDNVHVNFQGALAAGTVSGSGSADRIELTGVKFNSTVADGELVEIVLDGNLVTS
jgi:hypothetical protein